MQTIAKSTILSLLMLTAISIGTLFFRLGSLPLSGNDEPRYARIAEEMYRSGNWVTPTLQQKPWLEKPPLYYWATIPFYSIFQSRETAARFAPALFAFISGLAIFFLGSSLRGRLAGLIAASILLTSLGFAVAGRTAATDMPFTCCLTVGLAILAAAVKKDPGTLKVLAAYVFLGLAVLGKGPVAIILAAGIGLLFWYFNEQGNILSRWRIGRGILILLLTCTPWFWMAFRENGYAFITTFFVNHNIARYVTEIHHHAEPFYFYLPVLLGLSFPWSGWLPFLVTGSPLKEIRRWRDWNPDVLFLTCWFLFPILFFSLSGSKLAGYILPSLPPLALLLGVRITQWMERPNRSASLRVSLVLYLVLSLAAAVAAPIYLRELTGDNWKTGLLLSPFLFIPSLVAAFFGFRSRCIKAVATTLVHGLLVLVSAVQFAVPVLGDYYSSRDLALAAVAARQPGEPVFTYGYTDHSLEYYTGYQVSGKADDTAALRKILEQNGHFLLVVNESRIPELSGNKEFSVEILAKQGDLRLLRLSRK